MKAGCLQEKFFHNINGGKSKNYPKEKGTEFTEPSKIEETIEKQRGSRIL